MGLKLFSFILFLSISRVHALTVLEASERILRSFATFEWPAIILMAGTVVATIGFLVLYEVRKFEVLVHKREKQNWQSFISSASELGLDNEEIKKLEKMVRSLNFSSPESIFTSNSVFENVIEGRLLDKMGRKRNFPESEYIQLRKFRKLLGYYDLPLRTPLVSTRQFPEGCEVELYSGTINAKMGLILEVTENEWCISHSLKTLPELKSLMTVSYNRKGDADYIILASVIGVSESEIRLDHTRNVSRKPQRIYNRAEISSAVRICLTQQQQHSLGLENNFLDGVFNDISLGGASIFLPVNLAPDSDIALEFNLNESKITDLKAKSIRSALSSANSDFKYKHSIVFKELDSATKEIISSFFIDLGKTLETK
jgi:hypothetical protein